MLSIHDTRFVRERVEPHPGSVGGRSRLGRCGEPDLGVSGIVDRVVALARWREHGATHRECRYTHRNVKPLMKSIPCPEGVPMSPMMRYVAALSPPISALRLRGHICAFAVNSKVFWRSRAGSACGSARTERRTHISHLEEQALEVVRVVDLQQLGGRIHGGTGGLSVGLERVGGEVKKHGARVDDPRAGCEYRGLGIAVAVSTVQS